MEPIQVLAGALETMEGGWNRADAGAFAAVFEDDADFVDIRGGYHRGRAAIRDGHAMIFATFYKDSVVRFLPVDARAITNDVIVGHGTSALKTPSGMMDGKTAFHTIVLVRRGNEWKATAFHNIVLQEGIPVPTR